MLNSRCLKILSVKGCASNNNIVLDLLSSFHAKRKYVTEFDSTLVLTTPFKVTVPVARPYKASNVREEINVVLPAPDGPRTNDKGTNTMSKWMSDRSWYNFWFSITHNEQLFAKALLTSKHATPLDGFRHIRQKILLLFCSSDRKVNILETKYRRLHSSTAYALGRDSRRGRHRDVVCHLGSGRFFRHDGIAWKIAINKWCQAFNRTFGKTGTVSMKKGALPYGESRVRSSPSKEVIKVSAEAKCT